jgi:hypothetical protein
VGGIEVLDMIRLSFNLESVELFPKIVPEFIPVRLIR